MRYFVIHHAVIQHFVIHHVEFAGGVIVCAQN